MKQKKLPPPFWLSNVSNRNVSLTDLAITVKAFSTVNLMDTRHYQLTREQLEKSAKEGSIYLKRRMLRVRVVPPVVEQVNMTMAPDAIIPGRERSTLNIKEEHYEELQVETDNRHADEEKFAAENAELAELDTQNQFVNKR